MSQIRLTEDAAKRTYAAWRSSSALTSPTKAIVGIVNDMPWTNRLKLEKNGRADRRLDHLARDRCIQTGPDSAPTAAWSSGVSAKDKKY